MKIFRGFFIIISALISLMLASGCSDENKPPKINHIDLVLVIDKSGSMAGLESDTIGGFNSMVAKQKKLGTRTDVTTVMFNHGQNFIHERKSIQEIGDLTSDDYTPGGMTALLDSVGLAIDRVSAYKGVKDKDNKVVFAIITDGKENSSREYNKAGIKSLIEKKQQEGLDFVFLGANIDAISEAGSIGISRDNVVKYKNSAKGVRANYDAVAAFTAESVSENKTQNWKKEAVEDKSDN